MRAVPIRQIERVVRVTTWLVAIYAAWLLVETAVLRKTLPRPVLFEPAVTIGEETSPTRQAESLERLSGIWRRDLRQTLIEPPPQPVAKPERPPAPPPVALPKLLATFVEHGQGWGVFVEGRGGVRVRPVGSRVEEFDVVSILPGSATLRRGNRTFDVTVPKPIPRERSARQRG